MKVIIYEKTIEAKLQNKTNILFILKIRNFQKFLF